MPTSAVFSRLKLASLFAGAMTLAACGGGSVNSSSSSSQQNSSESSSSISSISSSSSSSSVQSSSSSSVVSSESSSSSSAEPFTGLRIQAQDYDRYNELDGAREGATSGPCAEGEVDLSETDDENGVCNVGWVTAGEWLQYDFYISEAGNYDLVLRIASANNGVPIQVSLDGNAIGSVQSSGGGWTTWVSETIADVDFSSGMHTITMDFPQDGINLNFFDIVDDGGVVSSSSMSSSSSSMSSSSSSSSSMPSEGDAALGQQLFGDKNCSICHASMNGGVFGSNNARFDVNALAKTNLDNLAAYISANMPPDGLGGPESCQDDCALNIAAYLKTFVSGGESSSSSSSSSVGGNPNGFYSEDFESGTNGMAPQGWDFYITHSNLPNNTGSNAYAVVDSSMGHSGSKSLHVKADQNNSSPTYAMKAFPAGTSSVYVRTWMYSDVQLGGVGGSGPGNHAHFLGASMQVSNNSPNEIIFSIVDGNRLGFMQLLASDGFTLASAGDPSVVIPANTWTCVEWHMASKSGFDEIQAWVNGQSSVHPTSMADIQNGWASGDFADAVLKYATFGLRAFGGVTKPENLWFDDIVMSDSRIGCD